MRFKYTFFLAIIALIVASSPSLASEDSDTSTIHETAQEQFLGDNKELKNLKSYLAQAAQNNNEVKAAFYRWQAAIKKAIRVDTLPDPRVTFGYYTTPLETRGGPARYKYGLSQQLPFFGKLGSKEKMALQEADGFKAKFDALKLSTYYEVKKVYYEYAYLAQAISITQENIELMRYLEKIATTRYTTGSAKHSDIIRPQVELGKLEDRLSSLNDLRSPLAAQLNALLDRDPESEIPFPKSIPVMVLKTTTDDLTDTLKGNNPNLTYLETVAAKEQASQELAERNYYPDFTFGVDITEVDNARNPGVMGDGQNPVMATMSFNIPIWQDARAAAVEESKAKALAAKRSRTGLQRKLQADLELALYKYRDAGRKISLYRNTLVPKTEQSLSVTMEAFMTGQGTSLDLIDAEKTLLELQLAYYRALTDQAQHLAQMEMLVGKELPCEFHGSLLKKSN